MIEPWYMPNDDKVGLVNSELWQRFNGGPHREDQDWVGDETEIAVELGIVVPAALLNAEDVRDAKYVCDALAIFRAGESENAKAIADRCIDIVRRIVRTCIERRSGVERRIAGCHGTPELLRRCGQRRGANAVERRRQACTRTERLLPKYEPTMDEREERCARDRHPNDPRHEQRCNLPSRMGGCTCADPPEPLTP